jgi:hypothetical protein
MAYPLAYLRTLPDCGDGAIAVIVEAAWKRGQAPSGAARVHASE